MPEPLEPIDLARTDPVGVVIQAELATEFCRNLDREVLLAKFGW